MLIPRITKLVALDTTKGTTQQSDRVFAICANREASTTLVHGDVVIWDATVTTPSSTIYGAHVLKSTAVANLATVAGVVSGRDIAAGDTGLVQIWGYHASVKSGTSTANLPQKSVATVGTLGDGAAADGPAEFIGICLKATSGGKAGIQIQKM